MYGNALLDPKIEAPVSESAGAGVAKIEEYKSLSQPLDVGSAVWVSGAGIAVSSSNRSAIAA